MRQRLRFMSFNIHGGRSLDGQRDLGRVHSLMDRLDIDIGVFQEMETRPSRGGGATDVSVLAGSSRPYHCYGASMLEGSFATEAAMHDTKLGGRDVHAAAISSPPLLKPEYQHIQQQGWYGNLIVSRYPISRSIVHNLETDAKREPRNAIDALIQTPFGKIRVIGTHLSLSIFERRSEARNLIRLIQAVEEEEKNPILLMGDINEWQVPSRLLSYLDSHMTPLHCKGTFPSFLPILKLDRVWYDAPGLKVTAHRVPAKGIRRLSDHLPLVIEIDYSVDHSLGYSNQLREPDSAAQSLRA